MPSKSILAQKQQVVADLAEQLKASSAGVLVNYQGITVDDDTKMRKALREAGVKYMVVKNSLTGRACEAAGYADMKQYADKVESFSILAGYLDGAVIDVKTVEALADIPSKEVLIAKFLGSIKSPIYKFAYALQAVVDKEQAPAEA